MKYTVMVLAICLSGQAFAQDSLCAYGRSNYVSLENVRSTCVSTAPVTEIIRKRKNSETFKNIYRAGIELIPGVSLLTASMDEVSKFSNHEAYFDRETRISLQRVMDNYKSQIVLEGYSNDPDSHLEVLKASIAHSLQLSKLLELKDLKNEEKDQIRKEMQSVLHLGTLTYAKLNADLQKYSKETQSRLAKELNELRDVVKDKIKINDISQLVNKLSDLHKKIDDLEKKISSLESDGSSDQDEIKALKAELAKSKEVFEDASKQTLRDIENYSRFAQGVTAIYSLFNPADASKISNAITGLSNIASACVALSALPSAAPASMAFGHYGMIAMGAVQLMNSFNSKKDGMEDAFKEIFKQLKAISGQITNLNERMDSHFYNMESSILKVERNILSKLEAISTDIQNVGEMVTFSIRSLNEIEKKLRELSSFIANREIDDRTRAYLKIVSRCIGKDVANVVLTKEEIRSCLNDFDTWLHDDIKSDLMTRKSLDGQYNYRGSYEWQINDVADYVKMMTGETEEGNYSNPFLLRDLSTNLRIMKLLNAATFDDELSSHAVFKKVDIEERRLADLFKVMKEDKQLISELKSNYKSNLIDIHKRILEVKKIEENKVMKSYINDLNNFKHLIRNEIIARGPLFNPYDSDGMITRDSLNHYLNAAEAVKYDRDPIELIEQEKLIFFAKACVENEKFNVPVPISYSYLKKTIGDELTKRFFLNPELSSLCFRVKTERNHQFLTYSVDGRIGVWQKYYAFHEKNKNPLYQDFYVPNSRNQWRRRVVYKGLYLTGFSLEGSFNQTKVFQEDFNVAERIPFDGSEDERFAFLTYLRGVRYPRQMPLMPFAYKGYPLVFKNVNYVYIDNVLSPSTQTNLSDEMRLFSGSLLAPLNAMTSSSEVRNLRADLLTKDQSSLWKEDTKNYAVGMKKAIEDYLENKARTDDLDTIGKLLSAIEYFKAEGPSSELLKTNLSEEWGLRSGKFLKLFLLDVMASDTSSAALDYVLENQLKLLEAVN